MPQQNNFNSTQNIRFSSSNQKREQLERASLQHSGKINILPQGVQGYNSTGITNISKSGGMNSTTVPASLILNERS